MAFSDELDAKLEARRIGYSPVMSLLWAKDPARHPEMARFKQAVEGMVMRMSTHPVFATLVGDCPEVAMSRSQYTDGMIRVAFEGHVANFVCNVGRGLIAAPSTPFELNLMIMMRKDISHALCSSDFYGGDIAVRGNIDDVDGFLAAMEDMVAEFLADVAGTPPGRALLEAADIQIPVQRIVAAEDMPSRATANVEQSASTLSLDNSPEFSPPSVRSRLLRLFGKS
jgi:hypothetical protein